MPELDALTSVPTSHTPIELEYMAMANVPQRWRDRCWEWLSERNARLILDGVGPSALIQDWRNRWTACRAHRGSCCPEALSRLGDLTQPGPSTVMNEESIPGT